MKECMNCGFSAEQILATLVDAAESRIMCPNCYTAAVASGKLSFEPDYDLVCDITGLPGAVKFINEYESYTLAPRTMLRLLAHDLRPHEWRALVAKYGSDAYMLHDDFYTADGEAWQPAVHVPVYEWRDVVSINGKHYCECFEISGEMDGDDTYQIDWFLESVAAKHGVDIDDVRTYMMDGIDFNPAGLEFGAEDCGCYIDGRPEWCIVLFDEQDDEDD